MTDVTILTPSFGQQSQAPWEALDHEGLSCVKASAPYPLSAERVIAETGPTRVLIVGLDDITGDVMASVDGLTAVAKHGVGVDNIDVAAATELGITVLNTPGANSGAVADLTIGLMLNLARQIIPADASVRAGRWDRFFGPELSGKTLGLVGLGRIASEVATRAHGFGMRILAFDPFPPDDEFHRRGARRSDLDNVLAESDFVSLHLPATVDGQPIIDRTALLRMKNTAFLVNAARGSLVDEAAVADALTHETLAGYAGDAFATEPPVGSPLLGAPRTILTPHIGAFTDRSNELMGVSVVEDVARVLRGETPQHPVVP